MALGVAVEARLYRDIAPTNTDEPNTAINTTTITFLVVTTLNLCYVYDAYILYDVCLSMVLLPCFDRESDIGYRNIRYFWRD